MPRSTLSHLQSELLTGFFKNEHRFRLTGGAALAGFHLGHRSTEDLDLFTNDASLAEADRLLTQVAHELKASVGQIETSPSFRRRLVRRGQESVVVDLVLDPTEHDVAAELVIDGIRVDSGHEILANKLCTLLSRSEIRDLVDVRALEGIGLRVEDAVALAHRKDAGLTPAQLAFVLSQWTIGSDASVPGGVTPTELSRYLADLRHRLARIGWPG